MSDATDYVESESLEFWLNASGVTPPVAIFVALSTTPPADDGSNFTEPGNAYARVLATGTPRFIVSGSGSGPTSGSLAEPATFPTASGAWGTITHFGLYDDPVSGTLLFKSALNTPKAVVDGNIPRFAAGELVVTND